MKKHFDKFISAFHHIYVYLKLLPKIKQTFKDNIIEFSKGGVTFRISRLGCIYAPISIKDMFPKEAKGDTVDLSAYAKIYALKYFKEVLSETLAKTGLIHILDSPKVKKIEGTMFVYLIQLKPLKYYYFIASLALLSKVFGFLTILSLIIKLYFF